jgi:sugar/nucleoside kinase (ribokinase family)
MQGKKYKVLGIGNAIVDIMVNVKEDFLKGLNLQKGSMRIVDEYEIKKLYSAVKAVKEVSGGSVANTIAALSSLGNPVAFIGKVGNDALGESFKKDLKYLGVNYCTLNPGGGLPTACCVVLTTPDAQRTMNTYLGISGLLGPGDIDEDSISQSEIIYLEGYLCDSREAGEAFRKAIGIAIRTGGKVAFSLSDSFCVERHRNEFLNLIKNYVDILFANEGEIKSLFKVKSLETAIHECTKMKNISVITRSEKGSVVISNGEVRKIPARRNNAVIDTTGAGDIYAAGFLHGLIRGRDPETCGEMGSIIASEILSQFGARLEIHVIEVLNKKGFLI